MWPLQTSVHSGAHRVRQTAPGGWHYLYLLEELTGLQLSMYAGVVGSEPGPESDSGSWALCLNTALGGGARTADGPPPAPHVGLLLLRADLLQQFHAPRLQEGQRALLCRRHCVQSVGLGAAVPAGPGCCGASRLVHFTKQCFPTLF